MTSQRKIAANRSNSQRSSGPRTADGKRRASGNSRKHGWAALERHHHPAASPEVEELAKVLCGDEQNPVLLVQARIIAENELLGRAIRLQRINTIELLAEAKMSDDDFLQRRLDRLLAAVFANFSAYLPPLDSFRQRYTSEEIAVTMEEYFDGEDLIRLRRFVKRFLDRQPNKPAARDECQAFELAAADLKKLERYETRAWSRQVQAIRSFIELSRNS